MYDFKPGQQPNIVSLVERALDKAESLLHADVEEGKKYFRIAEQHYNYLDPYHPDYQWIEFRLENLFVAYFKKQDGLA